MRKGWPPAALRTTNVNEFNFNDFRYLVDDQGTLVAQWMDNGIVLLVSTLHTPGKYILAKRRRPRVTMRNSRH
eukprot:10415304-Ditylum_brightwellii.AAC.1